MVQIMVKNRMKSADEFLEFLEYKKDEGVFFWKARARNHFKSDRSFNRFNAVYAGKRAGTITNKGAFGRYESIGLFGVIYFSHKIVWVLNHGFVPDLLDHIDGNGLNNKLENLRVASHSENSKNAAIRHDNKYGIFGVRQRNTAKKIQWNVRIRFDGRLIDLGLFVDYFEACCARKSAERRYGFHENHGRIGEKNNI